MPTASETTLFKYIPLCLNFFTVFAKKSENPRFQFFLSVLAEDAIKAALSDYKIKQESLNKEHDSKASG